MNRTTEQQQQLEHICQSLSKIMIDNYIDYDVFVRELQIQMVKYTYQHYPTVTRVAIKTAIDRRLVADIIIDKRYRLADNVLTRIIKEIQFNATNGSDILNKHGKFNSITAIISFAANGANNSNPVIKELIQRGYLIDLGDRVQYQTPQPTSKTLEEFTLKFEQLVDGLIKK